MANISSSISYFARSMNLVLAKIIAFVSFFAQNGNLEAILLAFTLKLDTSGWHRLLSFCTWLSVSAVQQFIFELALWRLK